MKQMQERNQVMVAIVGTAVAAALVLLSMNLGKVPFLHPTKTYHAQFANADGLKKGDDVRVEGVSVGKVGSVKVEGDHVKVDFTVRAGLALGAASRASVEVATVLGNLFMQVESAGPGRLHAGGTIPLDRTTVPYTLIGALTQFGEFSTNTDLATLRDSFRQLAQTVSGIDPKDAKATLQGLANVAEAVAGKQDQIGKILSAADGITQTLDSNSASLVAMLTQGDDFLKLLNARQQVLAQLLKDTANLGAQLRALIGTNQAQLAPLLANLDTVAGVLAKESTQLQSAVVNLGQFSVNIANATGAGPWIDLLVPTAVTPDNVIKKCGQHPNAQKGPCE